MLLAYRCGSLIDDPYFCKTPIHYSYSFLRISQVAPQMWPTLFTQAIMQQVIPLWGTTTLAGTPGAYRLASELGETVEMLLLATGEFLHSVWLHRICIRRRFRSCNISCFMLLMSSRVYRDSNRSQGRHVCFYTARCAPG
jgi:hypothetical protein